MISSVQIDNKIEAVLHLFLFVLEATFQCLSLYLQPREPKSNNCSCWGSRCVNCASLQLPSRTAAPFPLHWRQRTVECLHWKTVGAPQWTLRSSKTKSSFPTLLTFHQYPENILCDGQCCPNHEHRKKEGADGICCFIFRLLTTRGDSSKCTWKNKEVGKLLKRWDEQYKSLLVFINSQQVTRWQRSLQLFCWSGSSEFKGHFVNKMLTLIPFFRGVSLDRTAFLSQLWRQVEDRQTRAAPPSGQFEMHNGAVTGPPSEWTSSLCKWQLISNQCIYLVTW